PGERRDVSVGGRSHPGRVGGSAKSAGGGRRGCRRLLAANGAFAPRTAYAAQRATNGHLTRFLPIRLGGQIPQRISAPALLQFLETAEAVVPLQRRRVAVAQPIAHELRQDL